MRDYIVKKGFMAFQFGEKNGTYCIGIECSALTWERNYHCIIGREKKVLDISYDDVLNLIKKYGERNIIKERNGKKLFIIPIRDFEGGDSK